MNSNEIMFGSRVYRMAPNGDIEVKRSVDGNSEWIAVTIPAPPLLAAFAAKGIYHPLLTKLKPS